MLKKCQKRFFQKKKQQMSLPTLHPTRVVILVRNVSSSPVLHLYQASSEYSVGYLCDRADTRNQIKIQEGELTPKVNNRGLDFILGKFHKNWVKTVTSRVLTN